MIRARFIERDQRQSSERTVAQALALAERLPALVLDAKRLAASISHGVHGRRRSGTGENFWQFRPFVAGETAARIDWRRSGRDHRLYVREREWEAARTIWLWIDRSLSMDYISELAGAAKIDRAVMLGLALADVLVGAGERVGLLGLTAPIASRRIVEKLALLLAQAPSSSTATAPALSNPSNQRDEIILLSDFLLPLEETRQTIVSLSQNGARGHLVVIVDPVEEQFPFTGQAVLYEQERDLTLRVGDAAAWRGEYLARLAAFRAELGHICLSSGWSMTLHHTDQAASQAAVRILTLLGNGTYGDAGGRPR